ncbi:hypothetical protein M231_05709 [Tremella mesenterica]|uniref:Retrotransposon gag domain-containing protein n=1 Tax=Tremella mesenterica TaxID=5217 RepID=A0A4Q1BHD5_TREME|nr:hypothetical protein M231_05709 [Tremella mesenterica]
MSTPNIPSTDQGLANPGTNTHTQVTDDHIRTLCSQLLNHHNTNIDNQIVQLQNAIDHLESTHAQEIDDLLSQLNDLQEKCDNLQHQLDTTTNISVPTTNHSTVPLVNSTSHIKLKVTELPKFTANSTSESVDDWVNKITAILQQSGAPDTEITAKIPLLLQFAALDWFNTLSNIDRAKCKTWADWSTLFKSTFRAANYSAKLLALARDRHLLPEESVTTYFWQKVKLLRDVHGSLITNQVLVNEILAGLPTSMSTFLNVNPNIELTEFHRLLVDKEDGLRTLGFTPNFSTNLDQDQDTTNIFDNNYDSEEDVLDNYANNTNTIPTAPPFPCRTCGEDHWHNKCPIRNGVYHDNNTIDHSNHDNADTYSHHDPAAPDNNSHNWGHHQNTCTSNKTIYKDNPNLQPITKPRQWVPLNILFCLETSSDTQLSGSQTPQAHQQAIGLVRKMGSFFSHRRASSFPLPWSSSQDESIFSTSTYEPPSYQNDNGSFNIIQSKLFSRTRDHGTGESTMWGKIKSWFRLNSSVSYSNPTIPPELYVTLAESLTRLQLHKTLLNFSLSSKSHYRLISPVLYREAILPLNDNVVDKLGDFYLHYKIFPQSRDSLIDPDFSFLTWDPNYLASSTSARLAWRCQWARTVRIRTSPQTLQSLSMTSIVQTLSKIELCLFPRLTKLSLRRSASRKSATLLRLLALKSEIDHLLLFLGSSHLDIHFPWFRDYLTLHDPVHIDRMVVRVDIKKNKWYFYPVKLSPTTGDDRNVSKDDFERQFDAKKSDRDTLPRFHILSSPPKDRRRSTVASLNHYLKENTNEAGNFAKILTLGSVDLDPCIVFDPDKQKAIICRKIRIVKKEVGQ